jgi:hypothetical protein
VSGRLPTFEWTAPDGEAYVAEAAVVESFTLEREDHGMFTALVRFKGPAWGQALNPVSLDEHDEATGGRRVWEGAGDYIMRLVDALGSPPAEGRRVVVFRKGPYRTIDGFAPLADDGTLGEPFLHSEVVPR